MGEAIVSDLAKDHHVYAIGRNRAKLDSLAAAHPGAVTPVCSDLVGDLLDAADPAADGSPLAEVLALPRVDVLVHAAAIVEKHSVLDADARTWRRNFDINVIVPAELTRHLGGAVKATKGTVVFINSGAGRHAYTDNVIYSATKFALNALTDGTRGALSPEEARTVSIAPGPTDTPMLRKLRTGQDYHPEHYIRPEDISEAVRFVVDSAPTVHITEVVVRPRIELADRK